MYIGQSNNIKKRWASHINTLNNKTHHNKYLQNAWNKYGKKNFEFKILISCLESELNDKEINYIKKYNTFINGYNQTLGGDGMRGLKPSESHKRKISESCKGRKQSENNKRALKIANTGSNNYLAKSVLCDDYIFETITQCADFYDLKWSTLTQWLNGKRGMPIEWYNRGLRFYNNDDNRFVQYRLVKTRKIICDGILYNSISECARQYNIPNKTMTNWLKGKCNMRNDFIDLGLDYYKECA